MRHFKPEDVQESLNDKFARKQNWPRKRPPLTETLRLLLLQRISIRGWSEYRCSKIISEDITTRNMLDLSFLETAAILQQECNTDYAEKSEKDLLITELVLLL